MKNTQPHIKRDKTQTRQLPKLQLLKLEQLEGVAGGPTGGPDDSGDDHSLPNRYPPIHCPDCLTN